MRQRLTALIIALAGTTIALTGTAHAALTVQWMRGVTSPGTPAKYDKVGVIKVGPATAKNVLVLEPGTSAGSTYFVPLARWIVSKEKNWQVWSVERRENLLEDQSELNLAKRGLATATQVFDYYLGWIKNPAITHHFTSVPDSTVQYAKRWGLNVAVGDLHTVIAAAHKLGGKVVLGGHSLGGGVTTAYATWNFGGHAGADGLAGLVYIDGGTFGSESAATARQTLSTFNAGSSPWLVFGGIAAPFAGLFEATGAQAALTDPSGPSAGQSSGLLPADITPSTPVTNLGQYGYALNVGTSPPALAAAQAHLGTGLTASGGWNSAGALTPITRFAQMFSGAGIQNADGTEWYFPERLTIDLGGVGNGTGGPAQRALGVKTTLGRKLPHDLLIYGFGAALGGQVILDEAKQLARQSGIPSSHLTLINRHSTYAHNDPNSAYPHNVFFGHLIPFLRKVSATATATASQR
jgi:pimeloyl-ACP methyl ester carboxylesterase